jgi:hypothetical protein
MAKNSKNRFSKSTDALTNEIAVSFFYDYVIAINLTIENRSFEKFVTRIEMDGNFYCN